MEKIKNFIIVNYAPISVFALFFAFLFVNSRIDYNLYDEGVISYGATRIINGDILYKDFWTMYAPGQFYAAALLFKIFGMKLIVMRNYIVLIDIAAVTFIYLTVRRITSRINSLLCLAVVVLSFLYWTPSFGSPSHSAALFVFSGIYFLTRYFTSDNDIDLIAAGLFAGLTVIFKQDIGAYFLLSSVTVIFTYNYINRGCITAAVNKSAKILSGLMFVLLPVSAYFLINVPVKEMVSDLFLSPLTVFPQYRGLPYPPVRFSIGVFPYYFPILVYLLTITRLTMEVIRTKKVTGTDAVVMLLTLSGMAFFNYARVRSDTVHLFFTSLPAIMLLSHFMDTMPEGGNKTWTRSGCAFSYLLFFVYILSSYNDVLQRMTVTLYLLPLMTVLLITLPVLIIRQFNGFLYGNVFKAVSIVLCAAILCGFYAESNFRNIPGRYIFAPDWPGMAESKFSFTRGIKVPPRKEDASFPVAGYIRSKVDANEAIFVGSLRHDKIFTNDIMMYNFCERKCATKYHELAPGFITTREFQQKVIRDIKDNKVNYIVLHDVTGGHAEPNKSSVSTGVTDLDDFIKMNFAPVFCAGDEAVLKLSAKPEK